MMVNKKEINNRITSIDSIINITNAMKLTSVSNIKKYQLYLNLFSQYYKHINSLFFTVFNKNYIIKKNKKKLLIIFITSNKGLCGTFNTNLYNKLDLFMRQYLNYDIYILSVGDKGYFYSLSKNYKIYKNLSSLFNNINFNFLSIKIYSLIQEYILGITFSDVKIIYTKFISLNNQIVYIKDLYPIITFRKKYINLHCDYILDQESIKLYNHILPTFLMCRLFLCILHSYVSENAFRMLNMCKAHDNSIDMKQELKNSYNKIRQSIITQELCELVNGFRYKTK